MLSLKIDIEHR